MENNQEVHGIIMDEIREIKKDVKSLLAMKYQVYGIVTGVSFVMSLGWTLFFK